MVLAIFGLTGPAWAIGSMPWYFGQAEWYLAEHEGGSLDPETQLAVQQAAFDNVQEQTSCVPKLSTYMGSEDNWASGPRQDWQLTVYFDDPTGLAADGVLSMTVVNASLTWYADPDWDLGLWLDADVVYAADVSWASTEQVEAGTCDDAYAIEAVATLELAHLYGYEDGERIVIDVDPPAELITGLDDIEACDLSATELPEEVLWWVEAIAGPWVVPDQLLDDIVGPTPLQQCFSATAANLGSDEFSVEWHFGDGSTSTELEPCHTWTDEGQHRVRMDWWIDAPGCEDQEGSWGQVALVTACDLPHPAAGLDRLLAVEDLGEGSWQLYNQVDLQTPGCVDTVEWTVLQDGEVVQTSTAWSPRVVVDPGPIEVRLRVAGIAGEASDSLEARPGGGCSTVPGGGLIGLLTGLLALRRRRRG